MSGQIGGQAIRFLAAGIGNTLLTLLLYQVLLLALPPRPAYALTWIAGIVLVALLYPSRVFGVARPRPATRVGVSLVYVVSFLLGLFALPPATYLLGARLGVLPVIVLTTVFNFIAMRIVIGWTQRESRPFSQIR